MAGGQGQRHLQEESGHVDYGSGITVSELRELEGAETKRSGSGLLEH
jgi:hypothetical protein